MARPHWPGHPASTRSRGSKRLNTHSSASLRSHCGAQTAQLLALCVSVFGYSLHRGLPLPFVPPSPSLRSLLRDSGTGKRKARLSCWLLSFQRSPWPGHPCQVRAILSSTSLPSEERVSGGKRRGGGWWRPWGLEGASLPGTSCSTLAATVPTGLPSSHGMAPLPAAAPGSCGEWLPPVP